MARRSNIRKDGARVISHWVEPQPGPSDYEQLVALASRVEQVLRELESWLHVRERAAVKMGARNREDDWRRRRLSVLRHSQALLAAMLRDVEL
jgi:hypothetical protein